MVRQKRGDRRAQHAGQHQMQERIVPLHVQSADRAVDFEDSQFRRHGAAVADDHHQIYQNRPEFARHDGHQQRPQQLRLSRGASPIGKLHHHGNADEHRQRGYKPERLNADVQHLPGHRPAQRPAPGSRLNGKPEHRPNHRRRMPQFIPLRPDFRAQPADHAQGSIPQPACNFGSERILSLVYGEGHNAGMLFQATLRLRPGLHHGV